MKTLNTAFGHPNVSLAAAIVLFLVIAIPAKAEYATASASTGCAQQQPLRKVPELRAEKGALSTAFTVQMQSHDCIPVWIPDSSNPNEGTLNFQTMQLRTYGFPSAPGSKDLTWSTPGPTLRVRRASKQGATDGDSLSIFLTNLLPPNTRSDTQCNAACPVNTDCSGSNPPGCCKVKETYPECFHGDNNTNLHFHGSHVSPQSPQDYVLLDLAPVGSDAMAGHGAHPRGSSGVGTFQYAINPFPWNQAEGTHWYHPHKHGSVSLQILNGMAGALIIEGPFDDWLNGYYAKQGGIEEKVLVIQQLDDELNFFRQVKGYNPPLPLINGQLNPVITMKPGEIQRWRFINATMQASAQLQIGFASAAAPTLKQIAQDGIQFAPQNYQSQPLLSQGAQNFTLSPGNRADFLVQAPSTAGAVHALTFKVTGNLAEDIQKQIQARDLKFKSLGLPANTNAPAAAVTGEIPLPSLLTVQVSPPPAKPMSFPAASEWPAMPSFLADIQDKEIVAKRSLLFSMAGNPGSQPNAFFINNKQFDPSCVDETMQIGTAQEWTVQNSSSPQHPYHIHTNPYQIIAQNGKALPPPWIWWDTFGLPAVAKTPHDVNAGPIWDNADAQTKCPTVCSKDGSIWNGQWKTTIPGQMSVCGCLQNGAIVTRSRFEDYTGEYVIHCHFLGHEDRGMMIGVQTVCPPASKPVYGATQKTGVADNCGTTTPAAPQCSGSPQ